MISRSLRYCYGRGAARIALPLPPLGLEMVPQRPTREIAASLSPLVLAFLLPAGMLLVYATGALDPDRVRPASVVLIDYESPAIAIARPPELEPAPPAPAVVAATRPLAPLSPPLSPLPSPPAAQLAQAIEDVLPAIEIDPIAAVRRAPAAAAEPRVRLQLRAGAARTGPGPSEFATVARALPPLALPAPAHVSLPAPRLPAVSLAGPSLEGVSAAAAGDFPLLLATPAPPPPLARLPESGSGAAAELSFPTAAEPATAGRGSDISGDIDGVPLEALAACRSQQREDALKQGLMLAVASGTQCAGQGGIYSFLEARNLNAFLMRVASDAGRELGNRCDELVRAQMCVEARGVVGVRP